MSGPGLIVKVLSRRDATFGLRNVGTSRATPPEIRLHADGAYARCGEPGRPAATRGRSSYGGSDVEEPEAIHRIGHWVRRAVPQWTCRAFEESDHLLGGQPGRDSTDKRRCTGDVWARL